MAEPGSHRTDDELIEQAVQGDLDGFCQLVERWEKPVYTFLKRMTGSNEDAADFTQETFVRVFQSLERYEPSGRFKSWLFRIAGNLARSRNRRKALIEWTRFRLGSHDAPTSREGPDQALVREEKILAVQEAVRALPDRQRQAVLLWKYQGLSYREIAEVIGTNENAVAQLLHRATKRLRALLDLREEAE